MIYKSGKKNQVEMDSMCSNSISGCVRLEQNEVVSDIIPVQRMEGQLPIPGTSKGDRRARMLAVGSRRNTK